MTTRPKELLPLADVATPNLPEAAALLRLDQIRDRAAMAEAAERLRDLGPRSVLLKGGRPRMRRFV